MEAKRSITPKTELNAVLSQVRSYAKLLSAKYAPIILQEQIWVNSAKDDYSENIQKYAVASLTNDMLFNLRKAIGKSSL